MTGVEANWNPTLEAEFKDEVGSIPISGRSLNRKMDCVTTCFSAKGEHKRPHNKSI